VNTNDASVVLSAGIRTDLNAVMLHVPATGLTTAQQALVEEAKKRIGPALKIDATADGARATRMGCSMNDCDPPLRGGMEIHNPVSSTTVAVCTTAFTGQDANGAFYVFTAGHCVDSRQTADNWTAQFSSDGSTHVVGPSAGFRNDLQGDFAVLKLSNPSGWKMPSATVLVNGGVNIDRNENYKITSDGGFAVGQTICQTGARTVKSNCGSIKEVNQTITFDDGHTTGGMAVGTTCAQRGDSGGPVFSANKALGLISGGSESQCITVYQPIQTAEKVLGVSVLRAG